MSLNVERIKAQVKKAIAIMPMTINLKRPSKVSDGMNGFVEGVIDVASFNGFVDDSSRNSQQDRMNESGTAKKMRSITLLAVCGDFEIMIGDYFELNNIRYVVTYPGKIVEGIYNADLEVIQ